VIVVYKADLGRCDMFSALCQSCTSPLVDDDVGV
jgi:hypothetical protein